MPNNEIRAVAEWLIDGARSASLPQQILAQLCDRLVTCGIPLWRVAVFVRTLHPNVMGRRFVWRPGAEVEAREAPFELLETSDFLDSTIARVYLTADPIRRRLAVPHPVLDFPILSELRAEGVTDYFAAPLVFTDETFIVIEGGCCRDLCWNLFSAVSGRTRILDQAARSIGSLASLCVNVCHPSTLRMMI